MKSPARPLVIGIAGGSASGKSHLANHLLDKLPRRSALLCQDWYYLDQSNLPPARQRALNFDHPAAFDAALLRRHVRELRARYPVETPRYDYATHRRRPDTLTVHSAPLIIVEGLLVLQDARLRRLFDLSVFVDLPADVRLLRRIARDLAERGIEAEETMRLYEHCVRPMHERYVAPSSAHASLVWRPLEDADFPAALVKTLLEKMA